MLKSLLGSSLGIFEAGGRIWECLTLGFPGGSCPEIDSSGWSFFRSGRLIVQAPRERRREGRGGLERRMARISKLEIYLFPKGIGRHARGGSMPLVTRRDAGTQYGGTVAGEEKGPGLSGRIDSKRGGRAAPAIGTSRHRSPPEITGTPRKVAGKETER